MSRILSEVLNQLLYEPTARFTAAEIADVCECSTSMIYKVASDQAELSMNRVARLSRWLCEHGDTRLARCFVTPDFEVRTRGEAHANGRIDDDVTEMVQALGRTADAYGRGDRAGMDVSIAEAERKLADLKAERDRL